MFNTEIVF